MKDKNNALSHLLTAVGAIMFYTLALPILDSVSSYVQNCFNAKSVKLQHDTKQYQDNTESTRVIGFGSLDEYEEEEDYDE